MLNKSLSRRDFLKVSAASFAGLALRPLAGLSPLADFPKSERLGRVATTQMDLKAAPNEDSATLRKVYEDTIVPVLKEVVGPKPGRINQRWVDTGEGYLWSPELQPVKNIPNAPVGAFPANPNGMWLEVTVPYVELTLENPPVRAPRFKNRVATNQPIRYYYSQIIWADQIKVESGQTWYHVQDRYGSYGDIFWAPAEAFRPLTLDEMIPIQMSRINISWSAWLTRPFPVMKASRKSTLRAFPLAHSLTHGAIK